MRNKMSKRTHICLIIISVLLVIAAIVGSYIWISYEIEALDVMDAELNLQCQIYDGVVVNTILTTSAVFLSSLAICLMAIWFFPVLSRFDKGIQVFLRILTFIIVVVLLVWMFWGYISISTTSRATLNASLPLAASSNFLINQAFSDYSNLKTSALSAHIMTVLACAGGAILSMIVLFGIIDGFRRIMCMLEKIEHNTRSHNTTECTNCESDTTQITPPSN